MQALLKLPIWTLQMGVCQVPWLVMLGHKTCSSSARCKIGHSFSEVWSKGGKKRGCIVPFYLAIPDRLQVHWIQVLYDLLQVFKSPGHSSKVIHV